MGTVVDLSQPLYEGMPHATTIPEPRFESVRTMHDHGLRCMQLTLPTHCGTHLDAPSHFIQDGRTLDAVAVQSLIGPALCVEVNVPANTAITPHDLRAAGELAPGTALLIRTGWDALYGADGYMHHPYLSVEAAEWIVAAKARLVGIDVVTPELPGHLRPPGYPCPVHMTLLGAGVLILENLDLRPVAGSACNLFVVSCEYRAQTVHLRACSPNSSSSGDCCLFACARTHDQCRPCLRGSLRSIRSLRQRDVQRLGG